MTNYKKRIEDVAKEILALGLHKYGGYKADDIKLENQAIDIIEALLHQVEAEAEEYWKTYYGLSDMEDPPYSKLNNYQRKVLTDYHTNQLAALAHREES